MKTTSSLVLAFSLALVMAPRASAQMPDPSKVTLKTTPVAAGISMIEGANGFAGGNVGVSVGAEGVFIIDDELAPMTGKLKDAVAALSTKAVRFVINTHWHSDHTGGNPGVAAAGAVIVAQENVRKRLSVDQVREFMGRKITFPALPTGGLPVITFTDDVTLHLNGDEVHVAPAHTDGDSIVHFRKANVIHSGDVVTNSYPLVDDGSGGTYDGLIAAADKVLALCDDATKVIPGHGALMSKADVAAYRQMLIDVRSRVAKLLAAKKTAEEIKAAKPLADLDARWGGGMIKGDMLVDDAIRALQAHPADKDKDKGKGKAKAKTQ